MPVAKNRRRLQKKQEKKLQFKQFQAIVPLSATPKKKEEVVRPLTAYMNDNHDQLPTNPYDREFLIYHTFAQEDPHQTRIPTYVIQSPNISLEANWVYVRLLTHDTKLPFDFQLVAKELKGNIKQVQKAMDLLEKEKYLYREYMPDGRTIYYILESPIEHERLLSEILYKNNPTLRAQRAIPHGSQLDLF